MKSSMKIDTLPGAKLKVHHVNGVVINGYHQQKEQVELYCKLNAIYTLKTIKVDNWSTSITLVEIPGRTFNSVNFVNVD